MEPLWDLSAHVFTVNITKTKKETYLDDIRSHISFFYVIVYAILGKTFLWNDLSKAVNLKVNEGSLWNHGPRPLCLTKMSPWNCHKLFFKGLGNLVCNLAFNHWSGFVSSFVFHHVLSCTPRKIVACLLQLDSHYPVGANLFWKSILV